MRSTTRSPRSRSIQAESRPQAPLADSKDFETMDAMIHSMYALLSGPAGQKRDWDRFRSLFLPGACLILAIARQGEKPRARVLGVEDYVRRTDPIFQSEDFWESENSRKTQKFGTIAHVFSTYESRREKNGKAFQRGVNSIQLFHDGARWWIASVMWNTERE